MTTLKIYLAGPEVFLPDAIEVLAAKAALAREAGFDPVTPLDNHIKNGATPLDTGMAIYRSNKALMDGCDAVIANLTPFRGPSGDVGTAFEVGYMTARGARVLVYSNSASTHFENTRDAHYGEEVSLCSDGQHRGPDGIAIENFGMFDNLMLHGSAEDSGGVFVHETANDYELYRDLTAYGRCLDRLRHDLGVEESPEPV